MSIDLTGLGAVASLLDDGINKIWPDKTKEQEAQFAMLKAQLDANVTLRQAQIQVDLAAEQQKGWFTKGRDGAMWVCVLGLAWDFFFLPMLQFAFIAFHHPLELPPLDIATTQDLLGGLLGLGGMHLYQAVKGS